MENCLVCLVQFCQSDQISLVQFKEEEEDSRNSRKKKILRVFCTYFNLPCKQNENESLSSSPFPFCTECRNLVAELSIFHDQIESIQKLIQNTIAKITIKIINTEKRKDRQNYSNSDPLDTQNQNPNQEPENKRRDKTNFRYRQKILQNFNPRVHLKNCQSQIHSQKSTNEAQQSQTTNTNEINSTATEIKSEPVLNDEDFHDNSIHDDYDNYNVDVDVKIEENKSGDGSDAEIPENLSSHSSSSSSEGEEEENDNLKKKKKTIKRSKNVIKRTRTKSKVKGRSKCSNANDPLDLNSNSDSDNGNGDQKRKSRGDKLENLGDGKFLYKKCWPFHIIDDTEYFKCDTCQTKMVFDKNPKKNIFTHINHHIQSEHINWSKDVEQNVEDGKFLFLDNCTFEKVEFGFKCGQCPRIYKKVVTLKRHIQIWHVPGEFKCPKCPLSCKTPGLLNQHACGANSDSITLEVSPGKFIYYGKKGNWEFERLNDGLFQCKVCSVTRKTRDWMTGHMKTMHDDQTEHMCDECGKIFKLKPVLNKHKRRVHLKLAVPSEAEAQKPRIKCPYCPMTYKTGTNLRIHIFNSHKDITMATTTTIQPGNGGETEEENKGNMIVSKLSNFKYQCGICGMKVKSPIMLKRHEEICTRHVCPLCQKEFKTRGYLKRHVDAHNKVFRFFCDIFCEETQTICNKGFLDKCMLMRHKGSGAHSKKDGASTSKSKTKSTEESNSIHLNPSATTQKQRGKRKRKEPQEESSEDEEEEESVVKDNAEEHAEQATTETDILNTYWNFTSFDQ